MFVKLNLVVGENQTMVAAINVLNIELIREQENPETKKPNAVLVMNKNIKSLDPNEKVGMMQKKTVVERRMIYVVTETMDEVLKKMEKYDYDLITDPMQPENNLNIL